MFSKKGFINIFSSLLVSEQKRFCSQIKKKISLFFLTLLDSDDYLKYAIYNIVFILRSRKLNIVGHMHSSVNEQTDMLGEKYELAEMETDSPDVQPGVVTFLENPDNVADGRR